MEDFHCIKKNLLITNNNEIIFSYFAIFDGHSGKEISSYLSQNFHKILFLILSKRITKIIFGE